MYKGYYDYLIIRVIQMLVLFYTSLVVHRLPCGYLQFRARADISGLGKSNSLVTTLCACLVESEIVRLRAEADTAFFGEPTGPVETLERSPLSLSCLEEEDDSFGVCFEEGFADTCFKGCLEARFSSNTVAVAAAVSAASAEEVDEAGEGDRWMLFGMSKYALLRGVLASNALSAFSCSSVVWVGSPSSLASTMQ